MAGAAMLRRVARIISTPSPALRTPGAAFPSSSTTSASQPVSHALFLQQQEGWVFTEIEEQPAQDDGWDFCNSPTRQEAEDATSELTNALRLGVFVAPELENTRQNIHSEGVAHAGYIVGALQQLLSVPRMKDTVTAVVQDKAVWKAFSEVEAVKAFKSQLEESESTHRLLAKRPVEIISRFSNHGKVGLKIFGGEESESTLETSSGDSTFLVNLFEEAKSTVSQFAELLVDFVKSMFTYADKEILKEEDGDLADKKIKSCLALAVIVFAIVLVKRAAFA